MKVLLIFPPLVETNFGSYYPATAVLAAFVQQCGAAPAQLDLNAEFLNLILSEKHLERLGAGWTLNGDFVPLTSTSSIYARICWKNRDLFYDAQERQKLCQGISSHLLQEVIEPYRLDASLTSMRPRGLVENSTARCYRDFYERSTQLGHALEDTVLVGISVCMGPQLLPGIILADYVRRRRPEAKVVLGGACVSLMQPSDRERVLRATDGAHGLVCFEGEVPLHKIIVSLTGNGWAPDEIPNFCYLSDSTYLETAVAPGPDLASLPYPLYDKTLLTRLASPALGAVLSRGCYWGKCAYCDFIELYEGGPGYRGQKLTRFVNELEHQTAILGISEFTFITESIPPAVARRVSEEILRRGLCVRWSSFAMVDDRFSVELLSLMKAAGCYQLVIGMESMTDRVLRLVRKAATRETNIRFLRAAFEAQVPLTVNIIPNLPSTSKEEALESLSVFIDHADLLGEVSVFPFEATQSSDIGRFPEKYLLKVNSYGTGWGQAQFDANHLEYDDPSMTPQERVDVLEEFARFASFHNALLWRQVKGHGSVPVDDRFGHGLPPKSLVDVIELNDRCVLTNAISRRSVEVPKVWAKLIDAALDSQ